jgi:YaiO family outer membrane protein
MYTFYESRGNGNRWNPPSHLAEVGYYYGDANNITLGASTGHEVDRVSEAGEDLRLNVYDTRAIFVLGRQWLDNQWGLSYELGWHQMANAITEKLLNNRYEIRLGIRHRFGHTN